MIEFVVDRTVNGLAYPNLARHPAEPYTAQWREFRHNYPYTVPADLIEYCREFEYPHRIVTVAEYINRTDNNSSSSQPESNNSYYIIHLGFFDFAIDYIELLDTTVLELIKNRKLRILFYYHEGDNPKRIKERLDALCVIHCIDINSYIFVTGNTRVEELRNFIHFADHELLFFLRNKNSEKILKNHGSLMRHFSSLVRTHKWWRATALADLYRRSLLDNSYWSYNTAIVPAGDYIEDCPIEIDTLGIRHELTEFISNGPYRADDLNPDEHNDHSITYMPYYDNAYCNIVFETHFDADGSLGAFLTEKTFKPIKYGQPFVIAGCVGSLQLLRDLGYRVFDGIIDNRYDLIEDNTKRWRSLARTIEQIRYSDLPRFRERCRADAEHNQQLFLASKWDRLNMLFRKINND